MKGDRQFLQRYRRRLAVAKKTIKMKKHGSPSDLKAWKWICSLVETLGKDGMSSDESDADVHGPVFVAKGMPWRRGCESFMDILDEERITGGLFKKSGHRPERRVRRVDAKDSDRKVPKGLPAELYKTQWVESLDRRQRRLLYSPSGKHFEFKYYRKKK